MSFNIVIYSPVRVCAQTNFTELFYKNVKMCYSPLEAYFTGIPYKLFLDCDT